jgi:hypothetical protein
VDQGVAGQPAQGTDGRATVSRFGDQAIHRGLSQDVFAVAIGEIETDDRMTDVHDR